MGYGRFKQKNPFPVTFCVSNAAPVLDLKQATGRRFAINSTGLCFLFPTPTRSAGLNGAPSSFISIQVTAPHVSATLGRRG
jgi:hypothetical protein